MRIRERVRDRNGDLKTHIREIARNTETRPTKRFRKTGTQRESKIGRDSDRGRQTNS